MCSNCIHQEVCLYKNLYDELTTTVNNVLNDIIKERAIDVVIKVPVSLTCKFWISKSLIEFKEMEKNL